MSTLTNGSTYTTATELIDSEYISRVVQESLRDELIGPALSTVVDIGSMPTRTVAWPKNNAFSAGSKATDDVLSSNTAYNPTDVTATAAEYTVAATITDMLQRSSVVDPSQQVASELSLALIAQMDTSFTALANGFNGGSQGVGSTGVNLTAANMLEALKNLQANAKSRASRKAAFVLHPQQTYDFASEGFVATANIGTAFSREDIIRVYGDGGSLISQLAGSFGGVPIFQHSLCPTANSAADRDGMLVCEGAVGLALKWMPEIKSQENVSNLSNSTVYLGTVAYAFAEIEDLLGVRVQTDA